MDDATREFDRLRPRLQGIAYRMLGSVAEDLGWSLTLLREPAKARGLRVGVRILEIDEQLSTWRHRHMNMVHRMIGTRIGTGGSSGKDYLKAAADKHYIFREIAQLTSFLIERRKLPQLPKAVERQLGF